MSAASVYVTVVGLCSHLWGFDGVWLCSSGVFNSKVVLVGFLMESAT